MNRDRLLRSARPALSPRSQQLLVGSLLYARPSYVEGVARILDFGNTLQEYNFLPTEAVLEADIAAISRDMVAARLQMHPERAYFYEGFNWGIFVSYKVKQEWLEEERRLTLTIRA